MQYGMRFTFSTGRRGVSQVKIYGWINELVIYGFPFFFCEDIHIFHNYAFLSIINILGGIFNGCEVVETIVVILLYYLYYL